MEELYQDHGFWMLPSGKADMENDMAVAAQRELSEYVHTASAYGLLRYCREHHILAK